MSENRQTSDKPKRKAPKTAFVKGKSGNPGGRPPKTEEERTLEAMCRDKTQAALAVLVKIMDSEKSNERNRITAAMAIIERGHGKAVQPTTIGNPDGSKMDMHMTVTLVKP
jgi:hypothetical protein